MATQALSLTPVKPQSSRMRSPTFRRPAFFVLGAGALGAIVLGIGASIGLLAGVAALLAVCLGLATVERPYLGAYVLVAVAPVTSGLKRGLPIPGLRLSEFVIASLATIVLVSAKRSTRARWTALISGRSRCCRGGVPSRRRSRRCGARERSWSFAAARASSGSTRSWAKCRFWSTTPA